MKPAALRKRYGRARADVAGAALLAKRFETTRLHLNSGGYDRRGRYWGSGEPLFSVYDRQDGHETVVRAPDAKAARAQAIEGWARKHNWSGQYGRKVWGPFIETIEEKYA